MVNLFIHLLKICLVHGILLGCEDKKLHSLVRGKDIKCKYTTSDQGKNEHMC